MKSYRVSLWSDDRLLFFVVLGTSVLSSWLWWVPIRCVMDGPAFEWANTIGRGRIGGAGMGGHFIVLLMMAVFFISVVYMGWRGAQPPFKGMLLAWCALTFASSLTIAIDNPEGYRFRGDTMGIDVNLSYTMPLLNGALFLLAAVWAIRDTRTPSKRSIPAWTRLNTRFLVPVLVLVPIQIVMLRFGPMHDVTDKIGWVLTYVEWILINLALLPWIARETADAPLAEPSVT